MHFFERWRFTLLFGIISAHSYNLQETEDGIIEVKKSRLEVLGLVHQQAKFDNYS